MDRHSGVGATASPSMDILLREASLRFLNPHRIGRYKVSDVVSDALEVV